MWAISGPFLQLAALSSTPLLAKFRPAQWSSVEPGGDARRLVEFGLRSPLVLNFLLYSTTCTRRTPMSLEHDPGRGTKARPGRKWPGRKWPLLLILLSQKVAADGEENHLFGKTHTSAMGGWNGSAEIKRW